MADEIAPDEEGWLGQIILDGRWVDYARGYEHESKVWQAQQPDHRRLVHWITRTILVGHSKVCQGCGIGIGEHYESCIVCTRQHVRPDDDRWQVEVDDDLRMVRSAHLQRLLRDY